MAENAGKESKAPPVIRTGVGGGAVHPVMILVVALFMITIVVLLLYSVAQLWPPKASADGTAPASKHASFLWWSVTIDREKNFLVIVAVAGALGSSLHGVRSLSKYVGERLMYNSWLLFYVLLPLVGAALATIVYFVLRAGLIGSAGIDESDPFGFAAVSALVGLFSAQAAEKLKSVFEELFSKPDRGIDSVPEEALPPPSLGQLDPAQGPVGSTVIVTGENLDAETSVLFDARESTVTFKTATELETKVPPGLSVGSVSVTLRNASGTSPTALPFEVTAPGIEPEPGTAGPSPGAPPADVLDSGTSAPPDQPGSGVVGAEPDAAARSPVVESFRPAEGPPGTEVTVVGAGFDDSTTVMFGTEESPPPTAASESELRVTVPAMPPGHVPVTVLNAAGRSTSSSMFQVTEPA